MYFYYEHTTLKKTIDHFYLWAFYFLGIDRACPVCLEAAARMDDLGEGKNNLDKIKEVLSYYCPLVGLLDVKTCSAKVEELAPKMIKLISENASPEMICQAIGFCKVKG